MAIPFKVDVPAKDASLECDFTAQRQGVRRAQWQLPARQKTESKIPCCVAISKCVDGFRTTVRN
jgi:hypothetical protein